MQKGNIFLQTLSQHHDHRQTTGQTTGRHTTADLSSKLLIFFTAEIKCLKATLTI